MRGVDKQHIFEISEPGVQRLWRTHCCGALACSAMQYSSQMSCYQWQHYWKGIDHDYAAIVVISKLFNRNCCYLKTSKKIKLLS